ncbi:phosphate signaling complex protein PhoU [Poriferisphaera sp. WC338]|uniref:phosphate signaling complex protein PhoU n=1 Tax=Poriferisphaera sp. WC338 TaxID=3425129 RepID=UPI003D8164D1
MRHLVRQIDKLKKMLLSLGAMVEDSLHNAISAIQNRDVELAKKVIEGDKKIDLVELDIEEECLHAMALHQPVAHDLRFVVAMLKINHDLERIGDLASSIAKQASFLASESRIDVLPYDLPGMGKRVQDMLNRTLDALITLDADKAREVRKLDDEVDEIHRGMYQKTIAAMKENSEQIDQYVHLQNVSRQLERIADHAVNIAKDVIYMVEGEIVRHAKLRENAAT